MYAAPNLSMRILSSRRTLTVKWVEMMPMPVAPITQFADRRNAPAKSRK